MKIPSIVSAARSLLRRNARAAAASAIVAKVQASSPRAQLRAAGLASAARCGSLCEALGPAHVVGSATIGASRVCVRIRNDHAVAKRDDAVGIGATSASCVTTITVMPCSRLRRRMIPMISAELVESRLPVGSSASRIARLVHQGAGDGDALLLAAGELARTVMLAVRPVRPSPAASGRACAPVAPRQCRVKQRQLDILQRGGARQQVEVLKDEADPAAADAGRAASSSRRDIHAVEQVAAGRWAGPGIQEYSSGWICPSRTRP